MIRAAREFGQLKFLAVDLEEPPLNRWPDRRLLAAKLLDLQLAHGEQPEEAAAPASPLGFNDLAGQLRSGLDQVPGVRVVPFWLLAVLAAAYILLIGAGDYFLLRRFARRMEWTWATFPAIVAIGAAGIYFLAYGLKGNEVRLHQADLVDVDVASGSVRGTSWMNVFSPRLDAFDLRVGDCPNFRSTKMGLSPSDPRTRTCSPGSASRARGLAA